MGHYTDRKEANEQLELLAKARAIFWKKLEAAARELRLETNSSAESENKFLDYVHDGVNDILLYERTEVWENKRDVANLAIASLDRAEERLTARMVQ
jgi:hypothetical protein